MVYKCRMQKVSILALELSTGCWEGRGKADGAEVGSNMARRRQSCYSADKRHKQKLETMLDNAGVKQRQGGKVQMINSLGRSFQ
jgi:hypothetical protein